MKNKTNNRVRLDYIPSGVFEVGKSGVQASMETVEDSSAVFDEDGEDVSSTTLPGAKGYKYVNWGADNRLPYELIRLIGVDEVMSQNKLFNVLTCYGAGQKYNDYDTGRPTVDKEIKKWMLHNSIPSFMLEQATDMKYYFFLCVGDHTVC